MEISVIITNYNYGKHVARAIRSVINQSFNKNEYEIIVIDDCSTDNSRQVIESFGDKIRTLFNVKNLGLAESCNCAIRSAMGTYVIRLDADDYVAHDWLKVHHLFLANNKGEMDATSSDYLEVDENENTLRRKNGSTWPIACGVMYKLDHMMSLGLYDTNLPREDVEFRQRFLKSGKQIYNLPVPLYRYTQHDNSITKGL
jgi:glycosyltransferase involved in cell wall biosynthesis